MGQNNSSRSEKRFSRAPSGDFSRPGDFGSGVVGTRRSTINGPPARRHSALAGNTPHPATVTPHRRATSTASNTMHSAQRANNIASSHTSPAFPNPRMNIVTSNPPVSAANGGLPPPPSYTQVAGFEPILEAVPQTATPRVENALDLLKAYDTVFLIDDSGSMAGSLWNQAQKALAEVARVASQYDDDGIDIYFINSRDHAEGVKSGEEVRVLFTRVQPRGSTPTGARLDTLLRAYLSTLERTQREFDTVDPEVTGIKPINYIVITDGEPSDDPESVIVAVARRLDKGDFPLSQLGIQFVQIGSDPEATRALAELDDDLAGKYGIRDIVDTTPYTGQLNGETLIKILLGGINKRVDRRGGGAVLR